jgi:restriction endonuclease S subunit
MIGKYNKHTNPEGLKIGDPEWKTLGDVCTFNGNGKTNSSEITNSGEYPFYNGSLTNPQGTHDDFDFDGDQYILLVKSGGSSAKPISDRYGIGQAFLVSGKVAANGIVIKISIKDESVIAYNYLYTYLHHHKHLIQELANYCTNNGSINNEALKSFRIPVPSLDVQQIIVGEYKEKKR